MKKIIFSLLILIQCIAKPMDNMLNRINNDMQGTNLESVANNSQTILEQLTTKKLDIKQDAICLESMKALINGWQATLAYYKAGSITHEIQMATQNKVPSELKAPLDWAQKQNGDNASRLKNNVKIMKNYLKCYSCKNCNETIFQKHVEEFQKCGWCKSVYYCGIECQKNNWSKHKLKCTPPTNSN